MSRIQSGSFAANPTFGNFPQLRTSTDHRNSSTAPPKYTKLETHVVSDVLTTSAAPATSCESLARQLRQDTTSTVISVFPAITNHCRGRPQRAGEFALQRARMKGVMRIR